MTTTTTKIVLLLAIGVSHQLVESSTIKNCCEVATGENYFWVDRNTSGIYKINGFCQHGKTIMGYCDTLTDGGGWLVVQRRLDGSQDFNRVWWEYEMGFGKLSDEFWYGLKSLNCLTSKGSWEMRMNIKLANGTKVFLHYEQFKVASAKDKYKLTIGGFHGTTTDPMAYHNGMYFSTKDSKHGNNCALLHGPAAPAGGWWFKTCWAANPNNFYNHGIGVKLNGKWYPIIYTEIMIRPLQCGWSYY